MIREWHILQRHYVDCSVKLISISCTCFVVLETIKKPAAAISIWTWFLKAALLQEGMGIEWTMRKLVVVV